MDRRMRYTAGILHAIGQIARCCCFPGDYAAFLDASPQGELNKLMEECRLWDADHRQLGDHLAVAWKFPHKLGVIAHHHEVTSETPCMRRLVQASCIAASMSGFHTAGRRQEWEPARLEAVLAPGGGCGLQGAICCRK